MSPLFASCSLGAPEGIINRALRSNNKSSSSNNNNNNNICIMSARTIRTVTTPVYTCLHAWLIPRKAEYENNKSTERHDTYKYNNKQQQPYIPSFPVHVYAARRLHEWFS